MKKPNKIRADDHLVSLGLADSKTKAQALILAGKVRFSDGTRVEKPGKLIPENITLSVDAPYPYVSRGGEKLAAFLDHFQIDVRGLHALDVGASTGGFTDCLLQRGLTGATCIDVGHGQLHYKLRQDPRIISLEKTNARLLQAQDLPHSNYPLIVIDVSFISLTKILPNIWNFLSPNGKLIALIKPQFEASKREVSKGQGVIQDAVLQEEIKNNILEFSLRSLPHSILIGTIPSPIKGADGNQEFLMGLQYI